MYESESCRSRGPRQCVCMQTILRLGAFPCPLSCAAVASRVCAGPPEWLMSFLSQGTRVA
ncbi:hypothetical protein BC628DRAFT_1393171 [Trametes gibbosa]|nr:hypothetical protein BC628DRAFT_1406154 [Trametes gibbosa]KAI0816009.1 hypothetical protein BC628DRAFT_1406196 [Trametes gibbosa]KAI0816011.1 hypothetical protein BC628DRAFT_1406233 [Trametes gibbosa]KAI0819749.1 hypothetical protein BC628DRAFT_1401343 [Trametes gibbosa]KAI0821712.1 hypothetical protein BC628DRAFT_1393171 [Trametes gibbosa]